MEPANTQHTCHHKQQTSGKLQIARRHKPTKQSNRERAPSLFSRTSTFLPFQTRIYLSFMSKPLIRILVDSFLDCAKAMFKRRKWCRRSLLLRFVVQIACQLTFEWQHCFERSGKKGTKSESRDEQTLAWRTVSFNTEALSLVEATSKPSPGPEGQRNTRQTKQWASKRSKLNKIIDGNSKTSQKNRIECPLPHCNETTCFCVSIGGIT